MNKGLTTKQKIYVAAKKLFMDEGYHVSFPRIAKEIGVTQGLITYHFKSKRNLSIAIFSEDFEILSSHLKSVADEDEDIFLYILSFYYLNDRILQANPDKLRFLIESNTENIAVDTIYNCGLKNIYEKLVAKIVPNGLSFNDNLSLFLTSTFAVYGALMAKMAEGLELSPDFFFAYSIDMMFHCLGYDRDPARTQRLLTQAKQKVDLLLDKYPYLLDVHQYLLN